MRLGPILALAVTGLALAACATGGGAPSAVDTNAYFAQDFTCTADGSANVELASLQRAPARYAGKCITVMAFAKGNALYRDAQHAAVAGQPQIGLDWDNAAMARRLALGPSFVTLTGRVRLCSRRTVMLARSAPTHPETGCRGATAALLVSAAKIVPTAMD